MCLVVKMKMIIDRVAISSKQILVTDIGNWAAFTIYSCRIWKVRQSVGPITVFLDAVDHDLGVLSIDQYRMREPAKAELYVPLWGFQIFWIVGIFWFRPFNVKSNSNLTYNLQKKTFLYPYLLIVNFILLQL